MSLKQKIQQDMKNALKAGDKERVSVLRLLLSEVGNAEIEKRGELSSEELLGITSKEARKWEEAAEEYEKAGNAERAAQERSEAAILRKYLPPPLSEEEIRGLAEKIVEQTGAVSIKDLGEVMKVIMPQVKGRAEGAKVNAIVREVLSKK